MFKQQKYKEFFQDYFTRQQKNEYSLRYLSIVVGHKRVYTVCIERGYHLTNLKLEVIGFFFNSGNPLQFPRNNSHFRMKGEKTSERNHNKNLALPSVLKYFVYFSLFSVINLIFTPIQTIFKETLFKIHNPKAE